MSKKATKKKAVKVATATKEMNRPKVGERVPMHEARGVLNVIGLNLKGKVTRIFNDVEDRIIKAEMAGWQKVRKDSVSGKVSVGDVDVGNTESKSEYVTKHVGGGITGYLMAIDKDLYDADQAAKQAEVDSGEASIKAAPNAEGRYGSINMS